MAQDIRNERGTTIVEILVITGLAAALTAAIYTVIGPRLVDAVGTFVDKIVEALTNWQIPSF